MNSQTYSYDLDNYNVLFQSLEALGAKTLGHVNGSLIAHLEGTYQYLKTWGNRQELCVAGLYHAVYSTHGYQHQLVTLDQRDLIIQIIGIEAESIVYHFSACDRHHLYSRIGREEPVLFLDRFLHKTKKLEHRLLCDLLELTIANELEIARHSKSAKELTKKLFADLITRSEPYVSQNAFQYCQKFFYGNS